MHQQLQEVTDELRAAQARLHQLVQAVPESSWHLRPDPARWSMAECVEHLNLTGQAYLPLLRAALEQGRSQRREGAPRRYRRDPVGWWMWRMAGPPVRHRVKTKSQFIPGSNRPLAALVAEFDRLQEEQLRCVLAADGMALGGLWIRSPFDPRIRYNAYSCLTILPRHQQRHLWQAEQVSAQLNLKG
ncbi:MAG TPA: DinB family protein [Gemmatimonadales bacterium]|nr:DinB family protein [Gemmatimonadales bacterium]